MIECVCESSKIVQFFIVVFIALSQGVFSQDPVAVQPLIQSPLEASTVELQELAVFPASIELKGDIDRVQIVVSGLNQKKQSIDWTSKASIVVADPAITMLDGTTILGLKDGATSLRVSVGGLVREVPVRVMEHEEQLPIPFETGAMVALSKQGCNSGACHGSPSGKGGFRLSLRAFDPELDALTLIHEEFGRRINLEDPEQSLLLLKPLMKSPHGGGLKIHRNDEAYKVLTRWIAQGGHRDPPNTPRVVRIEVSPSGNMTFMHPNWEQQLRVVAHFADGKSKDVTRLASYDSSSTDVARVSEFGKVQASTRGESAILVRYLEHIESIPMMFMEEVAGFAWNEAAQQNFVDELVDAKLKRMNYLPSELCSDEEFVRRIYLDVIGIPPTSSEVQGFLADSSPQKRNYLIDQLLNRQEYSKFWALKWGDLLRMTAKRVTDDGVFKYHRWIEQAFRENMPYDQFAKELLLAQGSTLTNPPANFYRTAADRDDCVETFSQVFLGARLQCAKCHNHPFERWTQDNYYGLGAFFERVQRKKSPRPSETLVWVSSSGNVTQPRTGKVMQPWLPQVGSIDVAAGQDPRQALVDWLTSQDNPYFAKMEVNRIWSQLFSRGIVDPIDDFRDSNPPTNVELLDRLAAEFQKNGFNRKAIIATILKSRTYQSSFRANPSNEKDIRYFSHQLPRLLSAEQLLDAVDQAMGLPRSFANLPEGTRTTQIPSPDVVKVEFLKVFGQPERSSVCACERSHESNLGMAIEFFNGATIYERLRNPENRFRKGIAQGKSNEELLGELYLATLCRQPRVEELKSNLEYLAKNPDRGAAFEDIAWALLNTDEFLFQH